MDGEEVGGGVLGTEEAVTFQRIAREHLGSLYSLARRLTGDAAAEDLVQECLTRACRAYPSLRERAAAGAWLRSILMNVWRDDLRRRHRAPSEVPLDEATEHFTLFRKIADEDPLPYSDSLHLDFLGAFGADDVRAVLMRLPELYRAPLVLRYMEDLATRDVATLLDLPLGTVLAQLHRGRKLFERTMWDYAVEHRLLDEREVG